MVAGLWMGRKNIIQLFVNDWPKSGFIVANLEYRQGYDQSPENLMIAISQAIYRAQQDGAAAMRYLAHHVGTYPIDHSPYSKFII